jgi:hypothetical protein
MAFCAGQIKLAMNKGGEAIAVWKQDSTIIAAIRPPGGNFGTPKQLNSGGVVDDPWVALNDAGAAVATWDDTSTGPWAFHASARPAGGNFGAVETVVDPTSPVIFTPRVAVDPQGNAVAAWVNSWSDGTNSHLSIEWAYRPANGMFTGVAPHVFRDMVNQPNSAATYAPDVGVDAQGRATAVWPFYDGSKTVIETAVRPPGDSSLFGMPGPVSDPGATGSSNSPRLAIDPPSNTAVAVWVRCPSSCQVEGSARASGGGFQTPQPLSAPGATTTFGPLVGFDPSGGAIATWSGPSPDVPGTQVQVTLRPPGLNQTFGSVTPISSADPSQSPALAFDGEGNAIAIWEHDTTTPAGQLVQYAGFDNAPPTITDLSVPNGVAGQAIAMSANAFDRWSGASVAWNFGDGQGGSGGSVSHTYANHGVYGVTVTATDGVGHSTATAVPITVGCAPPPQGVTLDANCAVIKPPRIASAINNRWRFKGRRFTALTLNATRVPAGATVRMTCKGKPRCRFKKRTIHVKRFGTVNLLKKLGKKRNRHFRAGQTLDIRITKPGFIGEDVAFRFKKGKLPEGRLRCIKIGSTKPSQC